MAILFGELPIYLSESTYKDQMYEPDAGDPFVLAEEESSEIAANARRESFTEEFKGAYESLPWSQWESFVAKVKDSHVLADIQKLAAGNGENSESNATNYSSITHTLVEQARKAARAGYGITAVQQNGDNGIFANLKTTVGNFLRDAVRIEPPSSTSAASSPSLEERLQNLLFPKTVFEKRLEKLHGDASQLRKSLLVLIAEEKPEITYKYDSVESFLQECNVEEETERIAALLQKYPRLQETMNGLVPEEISYEEFWKRYFLQTQVLQDEDIYFNMVKAKHAAEALSAAALAASGAQEKGLAWDDADSDDCADQTEAKVEKDVDAECPSQSKEPSDAENDQTRSMNKESAIPQQAINSNESDEEDWE